MSEINSWVLTTSISLLVRGYFTGSKNTQSACHHKVSFSEPATYYWQKGSHGNASLFVCFSISLVLQGMSLHPTGGIVLWSLKAQTWPEWEMSPILSPSKEHLCWRSAVRLSFPPVGSRRKHLSPLSSVKIRCLCLFSVEQINCEWSTVGRGARKGEREMVERGEKTTKQLGSQLLVCVRVSRWYLLESHLCSVRRMKHWPITITPLSATFPASTCPPPAPIHSHHETVCLM